MKRTLRWIAGLLLLIVAALALVLDWVLASEVWRLREPAQIRIRTELGLIIELINTTDQALTLLEDSLGQTQEDVTLLKDALLSMAQTIHEADPMLESLVLLTGTSLPDTISSIQSSLASAQESADIMENVLRLVSRIPFFPGDTYNPEVSLSQSLADISSRLDSIPPSLDSLQASLANTQDNMGDLEDQLTQIALSTEQLADNIQLSLELISDYQTELTKANERYEKFYQQIPGIVTRTAQIVILLIGLVSLGHLGLLFQGIQILQSVVS
jgi:chromosome segregation ATPase